MKITGGTSEALALIKKLKASGHLIDVYSKEWMTKANNTTFNAKEFDVLVKKYSDDFAHHLLVVSVEKYNDEINGLFIKIYPRLEKVLSGYVYRPNFLFINLFTQQLLAVGLGRKNNLFAIPLDEDISLDMSDLFENSYIKKFTSLDHKNVLTEICKSVADLGICFCEHEDFFISQDDDLSEDEQNEIDDQVAALFEKQEKLTNLIKNYFPDFDETEINTGDY